MDFAPIIYLLAADRLRQQALAAQLRTHLSSELQLQCLIVAEQLAAAPGTLYLLMGLPLSPAPTSDDAALDQALRAAVLRLGISFQVIHADTYERQTHQALTVIAQGLGERCVQSWPTLPQPAVRQRRWTGPCEKCSDPDCEHQLFQSLFANGLPKSA